MKLFKRFFRPGPGATVTRTEPVLPSGDPAAIAYPPVDPGLPGIPVDDIIEQNADVIGRIKLAYGADSVAFSLEMLPLIRRYAAFVHLLPATSDNYFSAPGGLFRLGVEIALYALQGTDSTIFSGGATILKRRELEPRWRKATFLAGLCHELHRTLSHLVVTDAGGHEWPAYVSPLSGWLYELGIDRYYLKWVPKASEMRSLGVFAVPLIVGSEVIQELASGNSVVVPQMMGSISGMSSQREHSVLDHLVRRAAALVIDRDLRASADRYGKPMLGSHLERYLLDAMRRLVASEEAWAPNGDKSRVWYDTSGAYLLWPNSAADLSKVLEGDQLPGVPKAPETILEILIAAGVVSPRDEHAAIHEIFPGAMTKSVSAIRLSFPDILFGAMEEPPAPLERSLLVPAPPAADLKSGSHDAGRGPGRRRRASAAGAEESPQLALDVSAPIAERPMPDRQSTETSAAGKPDRTHEVAARALAPAAAPLSLLAPSRLSPPVRQVLESIVESLNGPGADARARTLPAGLFVPLRSFDHFKLESGMAVRALSDAGMLHLSDGGASKTTAEEFAGERELGVVIAMEFVGGMGGAPSPRGEARPC